MATHFNSQGGKHVTTYASDLNFTKGDQQCPLGSNYAKKGSIFFIRGSTYSVPKILHDSLLVPYVKSAAARCNKSP